MWAWILRGRSGLSSPGHCLNQLADGGNKFGNATVRFGKPLVGFGEAAVGFGEATIDFLKLFLGPDLRVGECGEGFIQPALVGDKSIQRGCDVRDVFFDGGDSSFQIWHFCAVLPSCLKS